jgi:hypothetical protein
VTRYARWLIAVLLTLGGQAAYAQSCVTASQVTVVGTLRSANGLPAANNIITLAPSNTGYIAGCGVNIPAAVTCATSADGSVVELADPLTTTTATAQYGSGSLPAGTYYVQFAFYSGSTYTLPSPEQVVQLTMAGTLNVNAPAPGLQDGATGMAVYIGATSSGETLQGTTTGDATYSQSEALVTGAAVPTANTTVCAVTANDAMWPVGTGYVVSLTDSAGNAVPKFQQQWQLMGPGSTVNLSAGVPWYHGVVYYSSPILASPTNHGQQGITGSLSLNGYNLLSVGRAGIGTAFPAYPLDVRGDMNLTGLFRLSGNAGSLSQCLLSTGPTTPPVWGSCLGGSAFYQTVQANGTARQQRPILDFTSAFAVSDDSGGTRTVADLAQQGGVTSGLCPSAINSQGIVTATSACPVDLYATAGCSGSGLSCSATITWPGTFIDSSYFVDCGLTDGSQVGYWVVNTKTTTTATIGVVFTASIGGVATFDCHGHHN